MTSEIRCLHCGDVIEPGSPVPLCRRDIIAVYDYWQQRDDVAATVLRGEPNPEARALIRASRARPQQNDGVVYYVRLGERVKIGWTSNLQRRLGELPHEQVLAVEPGTRRLERDRHAQFDHLSVAGREWFTLAPDLLNHVRQLREQHGAPA